MKTTTKAAAKKTTKAKAVKVKRDLYQEITNSIIALIEAGKGKRAQLWDNAGAREAFDPYCVATDKPYNGINRLILGMTMMVNEYEENAWMTYKQAQAAGWQVRAKEKGVGLCYYGSYTKENKVTGKEEDVPFLKSFTVFNVAQIDGYVAEEKENKPLIELNDNCEFIQKILANTDVKIMREQGNRAYYMRSRDCIQMPPKACFINEASYNSVFLHECVHSTLHSSRLGRGEAYKNAYPTQREVYAREELVAEIGAAFLSSEIGFVQLDLEFHASYLEGYLSVLTNDKKAIFKAASDAQKAATFIIEEWVQGKAKTEEEKAA